MKVLAILGSGRKDSNTRRALRALSPVEDYEVVDLLDFRIAPYRYDARQPFEDDFLSIAKRMTSAEVLLFATPVYWYSMSGGMKNFFDRLTDLVTVEKPLGRSLKGRQC